MQDRPQPDETPDALVLRVEDRPAARSEEVRPGVVIDYDADGNVVAVSVRRVRQPARPAPEHPGNLSMADALRAARREIESAGLANLTWDDIEHEVAERRGRSPSSIRS
jgi:uncharacterized protein YuzE